MPYMIQLRADVPFNFPPEGSDELSQGWDGAATHVEAAAKEEQWLNGEDGQGDYLEMTGFIDHIQAKVAFVEDTES